MLNIHRYQWGYNKLVVHANKNVVRGTLNRNGELNFGLAMV